MKSNRPVRRRIAALLIGLAALAALAPRAPLAAQTRAVSEQSAWPPEIVATMRSFFERVDVEAVLEDLRRPPPPSTATIAEGWEGPFRWVQQSVAFEPYYGSLRGAEGTREALSGNALDQALLLQDLYRARGTRTRLVRGRLSWEDATRLVGPATDSALSGDLWLRLVELTADHWWVEVDRAGRWVAVDPAFPDSGPDAVRGSAGRVHDEVPTALRAVVEIRASLAGLPLTTINRTVDGLGDGVVRFAVVPAGPETVELPPEAPPEAAPAEQVPSEPGARQGEEQEPEPEEPDPIAEALPRLPEGDLEVRITAGGTEIGRFALPPDQLARLELSVRVSPPLGAGTRVAIPWQGGPWTTVTVFVGARQSADDELRRVSRDVYGLLQGLVRAELAARAAFAERPDPEAPRLAPPLPAPGAPREEALGEEEEERDPWVEFQLEAIDAWQRFDTLAVQGTARALLAAVDRLAPPGRAWRPGVRLLAIRWTPAQADAAGAVTAWADDPVVLRGGDAERLQAAHDLLYSALLGQVLNRFADRPPVSAFDVTLRSVGTGSRLSWWIEPGALPESWPSPARRAAAEDLATGSLVVGPAAPIAVSDPPLLGWWSYAPRTGLISGRVVAEPGVAQASVGFGEPRDLLDLESTLASLAILHEAARFLVRAGDPETAAIAELIPRACAATALVRDLMLAGAPDSWRDPAFEAFCLTR